MKQTNVEAVAALAALGQSVLDCVRESKLLQKKRGRKKGKRRSRKPKGVVAIGRRKRPLAPLNGPGHDAT